MNAVARCGCRRRALIKRLLIVNINRLTALTTSLMHSRYTADKCSGTHGFHQQIFNRSHFCLAMPPCGVCMPVRPSVCLSVTFMDHVKTNKHIFKIFSPSSSHTILVFPYQTGWRYSDGNPPNGGVECRWGRQKTRFLTNIWLRCIQVYSVVNRTSREV